MLDKNVYDEFDSWNKLKKLVHSKARAPHIKEAEIWWCTCGRNVGVEINGKNEWYSRPVVIFKKLSNKGFLAIPTTTQPKTGSWYTHFKFKGKDEYAALSQIRVMSVARLRNCMGEVNSEDMEKIRRGLLSLYFKKNGPPDVNLGVLRENPEYALIITNTKPLVNSKPSSASLCAPTSNRRSTPRFHLPPPACYNVYMYNTFTEFLKDKKSLCIIQAENPDGDSIGSALALDYLLNDYEISLYCPVQIPQYLRYFDDWSRITSDFDLAADGYIIVDTASNTLLSKLLEQPDVKNALNTKPVFVLDHHEAEDDLSFPHAGLIQTLPACCDLIYRIAREQNLLPVPKAEAENAPKAEAAPETEDASKTEAQTETETRLKTAAQYLIYGILSDTLGLTSASTTPSTFRTVADLLDYGLSISDLEEHRREFSKKSERIFRYKADLIQHTEFFLDGRFAAVHIPWEEIHEYSNEYNPNALIIEELRLVENVDVAVSIKSYPDGRLTGKIRASSPIADQLAGYFGGGGHPYAAGFRTYDISYEDAVRELIAAYQKIASENNQKTANDQNATNAVVETADATPNNESEG